MKTIAYLVLAAGLTSTGCISLSFFRDDKKPPQTEIVEQAPPAVTSDGITQENASDRARALRQELEFDLQKKPRVVEIRP